uniref:Uncharacterized protein n=1 Tax=Photinus pyralis TaxID=7054 RepID=A0A1Y1LQB1_PHOPY
MFNVAEKVALVTGGAHGIGLAIVRELLHNGVKGVAILDVNEALGQEALQQIRNEFGDGKARFLRVDVSSRQEFGEAFRKAVDIFKQLDIVVNNAGILNDLDWEKEIGVNLVSGCLVRIPNGSELLFRSVPRMVPSLPLKIIYHRTEVEKKGSY